MPLTDETTTPDVAKVAAGLSEAQREALRMPSPNLYESRKSALRKLGLIECVNRDFHAWTALGLAVRDHIRGEAP